jgi:hypothetical protein
LNYGYDVALTTSFSVFQAAYPSVKPKREGKVPGFLIKWNGFSSEHDTWEPTSNLTTAGCQKILSKENTLLIIYLTRIILLDNLVLYIV